MAQAYQLPGEFRGIDMSAAAAVAGNQTARDQESMNNFIRQWDATTNILNANRMQSLRERQFAQEMINADRNFQLAKDQQEYNFQAGQRDFDLKKEYQQAQLRNFDLNAQQAQWALQIQKETYNNSQEALQLAPSWKEELDRRLGPQGAYGPNAENVMADFVLEKGINPGYKAVLDQMLIQYRQRAQNYQENVFNKTIAQAKTLLGTGELGNLKFTDPNLPEDVGPVSGNFILGQLKQAMAQGNIDDMLMYQGMLRSGFADLEKDKARRLQEEATIRASKLGIPVEQVDVKGGEMSVRFETPKLGRGTGTGAGGTGGTAQERAYTETNITAVKNAEINMDAAKQAFTAADEALKDIDKNTAEYQLKAQDRDEAYNKYQNWKAIYEDSARRMSQQPDITTGNKPQPSATTPAPAKEQTVPSGAPSIKDILSGSEQEKAKASQISPVTTPDIAKELLSPTAQRLERGLQAAETVGGMGLAVGKGLAKTLAPLPAPVRAAQFVSEVAPMVESVSKDVKQLAEVRRLRAKAQLAANARAAKGENPTKAYQEELEKVVADYRAKNQPTISVR